MKVKYLTVFFIISILFSSCKNIFQEKREGENQYATVFFSFSQSRAIVSEHNSESYYYTLKGYHNEKNEVFCDCISYSDFISSSYEIEVGEWEFTLCVYSDDSKRYLIYEDKQEILIEKEISTVSFTLVPATSGSASLTITLNYPENKGVSYITAGLYENVLAQDAYEIQIHTNENISYSTFYNYTLTLTLEESSVILNASIPAGRNRFVKFFLYDSHYVCIGTYTESVFMKNGDSIQVERTLENVNLFTAKVYITNKNEPWPDSGYVIKAVKEDKEYILSTSTGTNLFTGKLPLGTYDIYESNSDTGVDLTVTFDELGCATLNYDYVFVTRDNYINIISGLTKEETLIFTGVLYSSDIKNIGTMIQNSAYNIALNLYKTNTGGYIEQNSFENCTKLTSIVLPESCIEICIRSFAGCTMLSSVQLPETIQWIDERAFLGCTSLANINLPESIVKIDNAAFAKCSSLVNVDLPESLMTIGDSAFGGCASISYIKIPYSVESIGVGAFSLCNSLQAIDVRYNNNGYYSSNNGVLYDYSGHTLICYPAGKLETLYTVGQWVNTITQYAFAQCNNLTDIVFADTDNWYKQEPGQSGTVPVDVTNSKTNADELKQPNYRLYLKQ